MVVLLVGASVFTTPGRAAHPVLRVGVSGAGTVESREGRIDCGRRCAARFARGHTVKLRARPAKHFAFLAWSGACTGTAPECWVTSARAAIVVATFSRKVRYINIVVSGPGTVVSSPPGIRCGTGGSECRGEFGVGTEVELRAFGTPAGVLDGWGGRCSRAGTGRCRLVVPEPEEPKSPLEDTSLSVTAQFRHAAPSPTPVTLSVPPAIRSMPTGLLCPPTCDAVFASGTRVTLEGMSSGVSWWSGCVGVADRCTLIVDAPTIIRAAALPDRDRITGIGLNVSVSGPGSVAGPSISCGAGRPGPCTGLFRTHETVRLRAVPARGARFLGWRGFCNGRRTLCTVPIRTASVVYAQFRR